MKGLCFRKMNKIFFILVCIMTLSCNTNSNYTNNVKAIALESSRQTINENNEQKIEDEELVLFLDNLKKRYLRNK